MKTNRTSPLVEPLEARIAPAVVFSVSDLNGDGSQDLTLTGTAGKDHIQIDDGTHTKLSIDANNDGDFTDAGDVNAQDLGVSIETFVISLKAGDDALTFNAGTYNNAEKSLNVDLGAGNNQFVLDAHFDIFNGSDIRVDVLGGKDNDFLNASFGDFSNSRLTFTAALGAGRDAQLDAQGQAVGASHVGFIPGTDFAGSSLHTDIDLGKGSNWFRYDFVTDVGRNALPPSTADVAITGSSGKTDVDDVTLNLSGASVNAGSSVRIAARLLDGNDHGTALIPDSFELLNTPGSPVGGFCGVDLDGGAGNDMLQAIHGVSSNLNPALDGVLDLAVRGGAGNDTVNVDLAPFKTSMSTADRRGLHLLADGGMDNDTVSVSLANTNAASFGWDVAVRGGFGNDFVALFGTNNGGAVTFGPTGKVLVDGGAGANGGTVAGNFAVHSLNLAAPAPAAGPGYELADFDGNGSMDLRITGTNAKEDILVEDQTGATVLSWDKNADNDLTDPGDLDHVNLGAGIECIFIDTKGGRDSVIVQQKGDYIGDQHHIYLSLGAGENYGLIFSAGFKSQSADVSAEIEGGAGNDYVEAAFGDMHDSRGAFAASLGAGNDAQYFKGQPGSGAFFGVVGDIANSSLSFDLDLGPGKGSAYEVAAAKFVGAPSIVDSWITGSDKDADNVTAGLADMAFDTGSVLWMRHQLLGGNDTFHLSSIGGTVEGKNTGNGLTAGLVLLDVSGGAGNDKLIVTSNDPFNQASPAVAMDGLFDIALSGGAGDDKISIDLAGVGDGFASSNASATIRGLRLFLDGGDGKDTLAAVLANNNTATFAYDVLFQGGFGKDTFDFTGTNTGGAPHYGPSGNILLDLIGSETATVAGNLVVVK